MSYQVTDEGFHAGQRGVFVPVYTHTRIKHERGVLTCTTRCN